MARGNANRAPSIHQEMIFMARGTVKPPSQWAPAWGQGVQTNAQKWSQNYIAAGPSIFAKAAAAVTHWQSQVASPQAAAKFQGKLKEVNWATVQTTVSGPGVQKFAAAGVNKQQNYNHFASVFHPKLHAAVQSLPPRGPSGSPQNRARMNALLDAVEATRGKNF